MKRIKITTLLPLAISCLGCVSCSLDKNAKTYRFNNLSNEENATRILTQARWLML